MRVVSSGSTSSSSSTEPSFLSHIIIIVILVVSPDSCFPLPPSPPSFAAVRRGSSRHRDRDADHGNVVTTVAWELTDIFVLSLPLCHPPLMGPGINALIHNRQHTVRIRLRVSLCHIYLPLHSSPSCQSVMSSASSTHVLNVYQRMGTTTDSDSKPQTQTQLLNQSFCDRILRSNSKDMDGQLKCICRVLH